MKIPACTKGRKHSWKFVCNVNQTSVSGGSVSMSIKGRYQCACGIRKIAGPQFLSAAKETTQ